MNRVVI